MSNESITDNRSSGREANPLGLLQEATQIMSLSYCNQLSVLDITYLTA
jgi:hypothetical protein